MKKIYILLLACICLIYSCDDGSLNHKDVYIPDPVAESDEDDGISSEPTTKAVIKLQVGAENEHQIVEGFGCAFAGWANVTYLNMHRETIMDELFGENGLRLNICRGAVYEHYDDIETFGIDREYNYAPNHPALLNVWNNDTDGRQTNQLAQMWLTEYMLEKYKDVKHIYSTWTPPLQWKSGAGINPANYKDYADYLVRFLKVYTNKFNYKIYAISPTNEPNSGGTGWGGCRWTDAQLGEFTHNYLRPAMDAAGFKDVKIIVGEHAWWGAGKTFAEGVLSKEPGIANDNIIAAGHGYSTPDANIVPYGAFEEKGIQVWQTEVSDDRTRDETWKDAMRWAGTIHTYMTSGNTNAFIWWAAGRHCTSTGENLFQYDPDVFPGTGYYKVNRYYTLGHFSRYIPAGSTRVEAIAIPSGSDTFPEELKISAYVKDDTYTIVLVNTSESESFSTLLEVEGKAFQSMVSYTSDEDRKWYRKKLNPSLSGLRSVTVPKYSVVSITGKLKES